MRRIAVLFICLIVCYGCMGTAKNTKIITSDNADLVEERVNDILKEMTVEEKCDYIGGKRPSQLDIRAIERLDVPKIQMSDGPLGVRSMGKCTAYPACIGLAATWNIELAKKFGTSVGHDARAYGVHIMLAPGMNIYRYPLCGRNFEYLGEDPYLTSRMAVSFVTNLQNEGVLATIKHYICNNQEYARKTVSSNLDERTLREIYLPAFKSSILEADAACVMGGYNLVNGVWCTENDYINNKILKGELGFDGILMSDWLATHGTVSAANGGLDLEMPWGDYLNSKVLIPAIEAGEVSVDTIDDKVRRILRTIIKHGFLDRPQKIETIPVDNPESARVALEIAREAVVLLKNEESILPVDRDKVKTIAVFGPNAHPGVPAGGGSSNIRTFHSVSVLTGIRELAGDNIEVVYESGSPVPDPKTIITNSQYECTDESETVHAGLMAEYFSNKDLAGEPVIKKIIPVVDFDWGAGSPEGLLNDNFSLRLTGSICPQKSGKHVFYIQSDDGVRVYLDNIDILADWSNHAVRPKQTFIELEQGRLYDLKVEFYENTGSAALQFGWSPLKDLADISLDDISRKADVAVIAVGFNKKTEGEGFDRYFGLPDEQIELINLVAANNPNTIVILNSGGGVAWDGWLDRVPALLHAWYPGQEGGKAIAEIIFGETNPSGKLPATFEKRLEDNPAFHNYHSKDGKTVEYKEGIFIGYRGYDQKDIEPQFCFGYGLSYTTFEYSDLKLSPASIKSGDKVYVEFKIKNTGEYDGAETAQVYVKDVESGLPRPPKELKAFEKVFLKKGQSKRIKLCLDESAMSYYDPAAGSWIMEPGQFEVMVGASSRDIRLIGGFKAR